MTVIKTVIYITGTSITVYNHFSFRIMIKSWNCPNRASLIARGAKAGWVDGQPEMVAFQS